MSANREDENKITKIMGSYLLKGYTLLDSHCRDCQTPLMRTKTSSEYCIYCNEVNVRQKEINSSNDSSNGCAMIVEDVKGDEDNSKARHRCESNSDSINLNTNRVEFKEDIQRTVAVVHKKINWATDRLKSCDQINDCLQLTNLIKSSADLLLTLNQLTRN